MAGELKKKLSETIKNEVGKKPYAMIGRIESDINSQYGTADVVLQNPSGNGFIRIKGANLPDRNGLFSNAPSQGQRVILHTLHGNYTYSGIANVLPKDTRLGWSSDQATTSDGQSSGGQSSGGDVKRRPVPTR